MIKQDQDKPLEKIQGAAQQAAHQETAPASERHTRTILFQVGLVAVSLAFIVLAAFARTTPYFPFDLAITLQIQLINPPFFSALMRLISWPGFAPQSVIIAAGVIGLLAFYGFHWEALMSLAVVLFESAANEALKLAIHRLRPPDSLVHVFASLKDYSFPSGHVMFYVGFFGFIGFLIFTLFKKSFFRTVILILLGTLIAAIGVSRVFLGEHWTSDVLGGYLAGILALWVSIRVYRWGKPRFFSRQPVAREQGKKGDSQ